MNLKSTTISADQLAELESYRAAIVRYLRRNELNTVADTIETTECGDTFVTEIRNVINADIIHTECDEILFTNFVYIENGGC